MQYAGYLENKRHNAEVERLTAESQAEAARANRANEEIREEANKITAEYNRAYNEIQKFNSQANVIFNTNQLRENIRKNNMDYQTAVRRYNLDAKAQRFNQELQRQNQLIERYKAQTNDRAVQSQLNKWQAELEQRKREFNDNYKLAKQHSDIEALQTAFNVVDSVFDFVGEITDK